MLLRAPKPGGPAGFNVGTACRPACSFNDDDDDGGLSPLFAECSADPIPPRHVVSCQAFHFSRSGQTNQESLLYSFLGGHISCKRC